MKKYIITEISGDLAHAGTKATADIAKIASGMGYKRINVKMNTTKEGIIPKIQRQIGFMAGWDNAYDHIEEGSLVLLQHPFHYPQLTRNHILKKLKAKKHIKVIGLIHDVEKLRAFRYNDYYKKEFEFMMDYDDILIVHNDKMKEYFLSIGCPEEKLVVLDIFDYLKSEDGLHKPSFAKKITVAGNLDTTKCGYVGGLKDIEGVDVTLYGPNYDESMSEYDNIHYEGIVPSDELPSKLTEGFGLVWDGSSIDGCVGESGQYLKYNNPHKLSLYLSAGLPVVLWNEAAESGFVKENKVGVCVGSLTELKDVLGGMTSEEYDEMAGRASVVSGRLTTGFYTKKALACAEGLV
ncbi:MAG TPA: beta-1,6-galactofuranosyltransferase [Eubacterium sp.]|nr:beta-1,6-galactofuranosyltransferase [Eubacterium sp.]